MKVVIIGGGPGGYVAAIRAAQKGADVTLIEKKHIGGTCLNVGCIPTKVLLHTAELYHTLKGDAEQLGILVGTLGFDWSKIQARKKAIVQQLSGGVKSLLAANGVNVIMGEAAFLSVNQLAVHYPSGQNETIDFDQAIIATGSKPFMAPIKGNELEGVMTSDAALSLERIPKTLLIIGGGVIGSEFASIYSSLGTKVTIVEALPNIVANMDQELTDYLKYELEKAAVSIYTNTKVEHIERTLSGLKVQVFTESGLSSFEVEKVLLAVGRKPATKALNLEKAGIRVNGDKIVTNNHFQTNIPNIYAIGDCRGEVQLAHVASAEGMAAVEFIMGSRSNIDFNTIPYCVYTKPELAAVGLTEEKAKEQGYKVRIGRFPLHANGKSLIMGETNGVVKFVVDAKTDEILGLHLAGPRATELIVEGALALRLEATVAEIVTTIHAHPTVGESLYEAAHAVHKQAIHLPN